MAVVEWFEHMQRKDFGWSSSREFHVNIIAIGFQEFFVLQSLHLFKEFQIFWRSSNVEQITTLCDVSIEVFDSFI